VVANIRTLRERYGVTVKFLAQEMSNNGVFMTRHMWTFLEVGRKETLSVDALCAAATVLGTTPEFLIGNVGPACIHCNDVPPAGYQCLNCAKRTVAKEFADGEEGS
jgi:hypothetical protein